MRIVGGGGRGGVVVMLSTVRPCKALRTEFRAKRPSNASIPRRCSTAMLLAAGPPNMFAHSADQGASSSLAPLASSPVPKENKLINN